MERLSKTDFISHCTRAFNLLSRLLCIPKRRQNKKSKQRWTPIADQVYLLHEVYKYKLLGNVHFKC